MKTRGLILGIINHPVGKVMVLIAFLLIASLIRISDIKHPSFTFDEANDYQGSINYFSSMDLTKAVANGYLDGQLPFTISCFFYKLLGTDEWVARFVSVVFSLFAICACFIISRELFGYWWAILTIAMLSLSPFHIACSRLAFHQGHSFSVPFILLGLYGFAKINYCSIRSICLNTGLLALSLGLALGSDLLAVFWIITIFVSLAYNSRQAPRVAQVYVLGIFLLLVYIGFFIASPMYTFHPFGTLFNLKNYYFKFLDGLSGYLWLGRKVEKIPLYYYFIVAWVKFTPPVAFIGLLAIIFAAFERKTFQPFCRFLAFSFWPVIYLSFKSWKSPYYLSVFIPTFYILITYIIMKLYKVKSLARFNYLVIIFIIFMITAQVYSIKRTYPDYLMQGIEYGKKFYGEYQGPAVSHEQWIGEALKFIKKDSGGKNPRVLTFKGKGRWMVDYYGKKYGLSNITEENPSKLDDSSQGPELGIEYVILSQEAKTLFAPSWKLNIENNKELAISLENSKRFKILKTFYVGNFPMIWIYKNISGV